MGKNFTLTLTDVDYRIFRGRTLFETKLGRKGRIVSKIAR